MRSLLVQIIFLMGILSIEACTRGAKKGVQEPVEPPRITAETMALVECGDRGTLLQRLHDCDSSNPDFAIFDARPNGGGLWQLVRYKEGTQVQWWFDAAAALVWTMPLKAGRDCSRLSPVTVSDETRTFKRPTIAQYEESYPHIFPKFLRAKGKRYFHHADFDEAGMVFDEMKGVFINPPDDDKIWVRCVLSGR